MRGRIVAAAMLILAGAAKAEDYPSKPLHIVVPFAAGGALDVTARLFAQKMQESMGVPVVVDNRPGAGGNVGISAVAKSPPDGYTILLNSNAQSISPAVYKSLPWDPFADFVPITQLFATINVLAAGPKAPVNNLQELIALARSKPVNYGASGVGASLHLTTELLKLRANFDMQMIPFRSDGEIIAALIGDQVTVGMLPISAAAGQVTGGVLKGLAVTGAKRSRMLDVPTVAEQGVPGFQASGYQALFAPAKTPKEIIDRIYREAKKALETPEIQKQVEAFAVDSVGSSPEEFGAFYKQDVENFRQVVKEAKIPLQE